MNYYNPNFYQNYPYNNSQFMQQPQMTQPLNQVLNGKIVDTIDMVKATDVPIGGYGIYPKADLSEIYIKSWNPNGTTSIFTFVPNQQEPQQPDLLSQLLNKIEALESKIDKLSLSPQEKQKIKEMF